MKKLACLSLVLVSSAGLAEIVVGVSVSTTGPGASLGVHGLGLDRTQVELIADPGVAHNMHRLTARGAFGRFEMLLENLPLVDNSKTSALAAYSVARAVRNLVAPVLF